MVPNIPAKYPAHDYAAALRKLLPPGRVWTRDDDGTQAAVLNGLAPTLACLDSAALSLIAGAFLATADQLLPEWNASLALPDPCFGPFASDDENRQQVVAKLISTGGQAIAYYESLAATLGYTIQVTEFSAHTVIRTVTTPIAGELWAYAWQVNIVNPPPVELHTVDDPVEGALASLGSAPEQQVLECLLRKTMPAHTVLIFTYLGG